MKPKNKDQVTQPKFLGHFDLVVLCSMLMLGGLIAVVLGIGSRSPLRTTNFSWEGKTVGVEDSHFTITFNRPVDRNQIEKALTIEPSLPGKIGWRGRSLIYNLTEVPSYGTSYQVDFQQADLSDQISSTHSFQSRDRTAAYLGVEASEAGRLILVNLTKQHKSILTPADLVVTDFQLYPDGKRVLFSAYERGAREGFQQQQLYTVTTGINFAEAETQPVGRIEQILPGKNYQNLQFDLSANGKTIVVERVNRQNPAEAGIWVVPQEGDPRPLGIRANHFVVSPNGKTVLVAGEKGVTVVPLSAEAGSSQYFPGYGAVLGFSPDGEQKLLVRYNPDYTRSLVLVDSAGKTQELFSSTSPITACQFDPQQTNNLYCLKTNTIEQQGQYIEVPFLTQIDLEGEDLPLLALSNYGDIELSISPDGNGLLFDQLVTTVASSPSQIVTAEGEAVTAGLLWLLPLNNLQGDNVTMPQELLPGYNPVWLP